MGGKPGGGHRTLRKMNKTIKQIRVHLRAMIHVHLNRRGPRGRNTSRDLFSKTRMKERHLDSGRSNSLRNSFGSFDEISFDRSNVRRGLDLHLFRLRHTGGIEKPRCCPFGGENRRLDALPFQAGRQHSDVSSLWIAGLKASQHVRHSIHRPAHRNGSCRHRPLFKNLTNPSHALWIQTCKDSPLEIIHGGCRISLEQGICYLEGSVRQLGLLTCAVERKCVSVIDEVGGVARVAGSFFQEKDGRLEVAFL